MRPFLKTISIFAVFLFLPNLQANAQQLTREQWGGPPINVTHAAGKWIIAGKKTEVTLTEKDLAVSVQAGPVTWNMAPSRADDMQVKFAGEVFPVQLASAGLARLEPYGTGYKTGVKITLSEFRGNGMLHPFAPLDLTIYLTICLEGASEELVMDVAADEHEATLRQLDWPGAMDAHDVDYTVLPNHEGTLLPRNWPKAFTPNNSGGTDQSFVQSHVIECWSMSWWGFQKGKSAMMVISETPDDAAYQFSHPPGGPTVMGPRWLAQLGRFAYPRSVRMIFFTDGNYVTLAKRYRQYVMDTGLFVSLKEKIVRQPLVADLIGTPHFRTHALKNLREGSWVYDPTKPEKNYHLTTFDEQAKQLREWKKQGYDKLIVILAAWPYLGYDRQHPNGLPPAPQAGGWEGLKRFFDTAQELKYTAMLHDQYRDFYTDAPSWDPQFAIHEEDTVSPPSEFPGTRFKEWKKGYLPFMDHWDGGEMSYLNPRFMLGHMKRNYALIFAHGIHPTGSQLDVFGYVPPDQDFNPEHPTTKTDGMNGRIANFQWTRQNLGIVGTETGSDWVVPYADMTSPRHAGQAIPVPLYDLVFHDAIVTEYRENPLRGILYGGVPTIYAFSERENMDQKLVHLMAGLHARVGLLEMTNHEFLDKDYKKERTTFSDGTTVTVDWDKNDVKISPEIKTAN